MTVRRPQRLILAGLLGTLALGGAGIGCTDHDRPTEYGKQRPPVDQLDSRDRGLQSADVLQASDKIIASLMASPELNQSSKKWTLVISHVEDRTRDKKFSGVDYNIFLERLRKNIAQQGRGRLALIENKDRFYDEYAGPPPSLFFCDADHSYEATKADILWARSVGSSIICGDDYDHPLERGTARAVDELGGPSRRAGGLFVM